MNKFIRKSKSRKAFEGFNFAVMCILIVLTIYPVLYVLFASLSDSNMLLRNGGKLLFRPLGFNITAYQKVLQNSKIMSGYRNTVFVVLVGTFLSMFVSALGAFVLSKKELMFNKFISILVVIPMFFGGGLIPFYMSVRSLGLINSIWSLIFPSLINTYNLIVLRAGFDSVPKDMEESALIDGANYWTILFKIYMPLIKASIAVVALYYGVTYWNSWFHASIFLQGASQKWPLQLVLRQILMQNDSSSMGQLGSIADEERIGESIKYAVIIIATVPVFCIYPFIQRYFEKGVMIGAVKG